jgi:PleD family two-component response regulator
MRVAANPLLTVDKLRIYEQFDGDIGCGARTSERDCEALLVRADAAMYGARKAWRAQETQ